jgi:Host cell surface-exposed lipoprotein
VDANTNTTPLPPPDVQPPRRRHRARKTLLIIGGAFLALIVLIVIVSVATAKPKPAAAPLPTATPTSITDVNGYACASISPDGFCPQDPATTATTAPATSAPASTAPASSAPASTAPASSAPANTAPAMSAADQQAVEAAQGYLNLGSGFSAESLFKQLTSSYGNGFTAAQANFAINYLHPDWDQQAVEAAKGYMALGTGFSRESLIQQLTSSYGNGFTYAQAEYAATQVGL